jgi:CSLREA domain-containing protein
VKGRAAFITVTVLMAVGAPAPAQAAPFTVTRVDDPVPDACVVGDCSLREAIRAANAAPGADSIALEADTYVLERPGTDEGAALDGDLDVTDDLTLTGAGAVATAIDGRRATTLERVLSIDPVAQAPPSRVTIADLAITGGGGDRGGALRSENAAAVTLERVSLSGNAVSAFGGALYNDAATIAIRDSQIAGNSSEAFAGAIFNTGDTASLTIEGTTITGNQGSSSGGIYANNAGRISIDESVLAGNRGSLGGAFYLQNDSTTTITDTLVSGNIVAAPSESPSEFGGGIYIQNDATVTITNTTVTGNRADDNGGGISLRNSPTVRLASVTVAGNRADFDGSGDLGGGISLDVEPPGSLRVANSIVADNTNAAAPDCGGPDSVTSAGYNLIGNVQGCLFSAGNGDQVGTAAAPVDPLLGPLAANGGPTQTMALAPESPAIDNGNPAAPGAGADACPATDQRGAPRDVCDVGAYELLAESGSGGSTTCKGVPATLFATPGVPLAGTGAGDVIVGTPGSDSIKAGGGDDTVCAGDGRDKLWGQAGKDRLLGEDGKDKLKGGGGKDRLDGGRGADKLSCGGGKDKAKGGPGRDRSNGCEKGKP